MRSTAIALFVTLIAFTAAAQNTSPIVQKIEPSSGPVAGGTHLVITGENLNPLCPPYMIFCADLSVQIDGKPAQILERSYDRLVVVTPARSSGAADVEVRTNRGVARMPRSFTYGATDFRRILLPVLMIDEVGGAQGSRWKTELAGYHRGADSIRVTDDPARSGGDVTGRGAFTPQIATARPGRGRFIYVTSATAQAVTLNLRARDVSRESENLGTELPVVGQDDTFGASSTIPLLNIPMQQQYRQKVRIYDFEGESARTVTVRIFGDNSATPAVTREVKLSAEATNADYPEYPGQADIDLDQMPELSGFSRVTVTIDTPADGRFWAFATITNNDTQLITTVTP